MRPYRDVRYINGTGLIGLFYHNDELWFVLVHKSSYEGSIP